MIPVVDRPADHHGDHAVRRIEQRDPQLASGVDAETAWRELQDLGVVPARVPDLDDDAGLPAEQRLALGDHLESRVRLDGVDRVSDTSGLDERPAVADDALHLRELHRDDVGRASLLLDVEEARRERADRPSLADLEGHWRLEPRSRVDAGLQFAGGQRPRRLGRAGRRG